MTSNWVLKTARPDKDRPVVLKYKNNNGALILSNCLWTWDVDRWAWYRNTSTWMDDGDVMYWAYVENN